MSSVVSPVQRWLVASVGRSRPFIADWRNGVEIVGYAALALVLMWPVTLHLNSRMIGTGDGEFYAWLGWRLAELVRDGDLPILIPDAVYPDNYNVSLGDGYGAYLVMAAWNLLVNPYLAINLTVFAAYLLNFLAGRRLGRIVAPDSRAVWMVTALALGSAPPLLLRAYGHYHLCFSFAAALVIAEAVLYAKERRRLRILRIGVLLAVAFLFSVYWFASSLTALAVVAGVAALRRRELMMCGGRLCAALAVAVLLLMPLVVPRLIFQHREASSPTQNALQQIDNERNTANFSADLLSVIAQPSGSRIELPGAARLHRDFNPNRLEATIFPGLLLVTALFALAFVPSPLRAPILSAAFAVWILSLGPALIIDGARLGINGRTLGFLPMELIYQIPGTSALRTPSRMAVALPAIATVALAVIAGEGARRVQRRRWILLPAVASVAVLSTNLIAVPYTQRDLPSALRAALERVKASAEPRDTMLEVPFDSGGQYIQLIRYQMTHRVPMLGFHAQHSALPWYSGFKQYRASTGLAELRCFPPLIGYGPAPYPPDLRRTGRELADIQREFGVRFIFVNKELLERPYCDARRGEIKAILNETRLLGAGPTWEIRELVTA
jgi:hypothetical protein